MKMEMIAAFSQIPQPPRESFGFIDDIRRPLAHHFHPGGGSQAEFMRDGVELCVEYPGNGSFPKTAFVSLERVLSAGGIVLKKGGYPIRFVQNKAFEHEEYEVCTAPEGTVVTAGDADGLRRAVYFLEDRICEAGGKSVTEGCWRRKPFVKHRISRCFFGPTNRPPFFIDELTGDVDYYPEEYLNKLAHEGVNGLWLTMYFRDLPSSVFPGRGGDAEKRFARLRLTVERCMRYGIRIYVFLSEPKLFGNAHHAVPLSDAAVHPEVASERSLGNGFKTFCTSSEAGRKYLRESMEQIFSAVPELGGVINIMFGEDNGSCARYMASGINICPVCGKRDFADIYREEALLYSEIIHKYNPDAEYIGWLYAPSQRDGSEQMQMLLRIAEKWPDCATLMFNFESGGASEQLGKKRIVFDYSLAYIGPSELFAKGTGAVSRSGAKLQVGCSHENAAVPFIPVPENLYDKYRFMHEHGVSAAMQCWYFGNYPGLMNKAAGELSFEPFPENAEEFLLALARPDWGKNAEMVSSAWSCFSRGYRKFPSNIAFEWYGPLHHCIAWPWHLFPVDQPISPSWILKNFPEVSGDRIGECLCYHHTLAEALELCTEMSDEWQRGVAIMEFLRRDYEDNPERLADIDLAQAVGLQMKSTVNLLKFYSLREDMLYNRRDNLAAMAEIVKDEIRNTRKMKVLCERDCRLGYHSEAEGYLFFPEKLAGRIQLLMALLKEDFPKFDLNAPWIDGYTGRTPGGAVARCVRYGEEENIYPMGENASWSASCDEKNLYLTLRNVNDADFSVVLEPCRMWPAFRIDFTANGGIYPYSSMFPHMPDYRVEKDGSDMRLVIPLDFFDGFRRPGFPVRFNIFGSRFHWSAPETWSHRLLHGNYNPAGSGWLFWE